MYSSTSPSGAAPVRPKKERKLSLVFRHTESDTKHCSGVESVLLVPGRRILFTASRDATVKRWNVGGPTPWFEASFEGHTDWVNDIALVNDVLVSCSNDRTVRLWRGTAQGTLLMTLNHHSDYVMCLAASGTRNVVATAGLRGEVFMIDITTGSNVRLYPKSKPAEQPPSQQQSPQRLREPMDLDDAPRCSPSSSGSKGSIYALAMNESGTLLAAGGADHLVRLWDPRTNGKIAKLRSHSDYVRALTISADGMHALSGGSDGTVKLWDIGMQRCVQTYKVHSDSVWALRASDDFSTVYSGGRDKCVFRTSLSSRSAELLLMEQHPVRSLALDSSEGALWVSSESPHVNKWQVCGQEQQASRAKAFPVFDRASLRMRQSHDIKRNVESLASSPSTNVEGVPPIIHHKVLNDRRHILTKDMEGNVALWDVLTGGVVQSYGKVDMAAKERELFEPQSVPSWFSLDVRMGQLCISLEPPSCFLAEEYALALGMPEVAEDVKINYGKLALDGAFAKWRRRVLFMDQQQHSPGSPPAPQWNEDGPMYGEMWPKYWDQGTLPPAVICQNSSDIPWRLLATQFTGNEMDPENLPTWVVEAVLKGSFPTTKEAKLAFILVPVDGSQMPMLMQSKLNAPRILQVHKVASYCIAKLQEQNIHLDMRPQYLRRPEHAPAEESEEGRPALELICNGVGVPYEMSLASIKKYIWRKGDDLVFHFRVRDPLNPIALPVIQPS